jgi:hypothetical protein
VGEDPTVFRNPTADFALPVDLIRDLSELAAFARRHRDKPGTSYSTSFDAEGRETCTDPGFLNLEKELPKRLERQDGYLGKIVFEHRDAHARRAAYYGGFRVAEIQSTLQFIVMLASEPVRDLRFDGFRLALPFLDRWLPVTDPNSGAFAYQLDLEPFARLLHSRSALDRVAAIEVLRLALRHRRKETLPAVQFLEPQLREGLASESRALHAATAKLIAELAGDDSAAHGDAEVLEQRLAAELKKALPPLRRISDGLVELYPSTELQEAADWVRKALERGSFGGFGEIPATHNRPRVVRGLMVSALPKEIAVAGLQAGDCIVAVNGVPVFSCRELLDSLRGAIERGQPLNPNLSLQQV